MGVEGMTPAPGMMDQTSSELKENKVGRLEIGPAYSVSSGLPNSREIHAGGGLPTSLRLNVCEHAGMNSIQEVEVIGIQYETRDNEPQKRPVGDYSGEMVSATGKLREDPSVEVRLRWDSQNPQYTSEIRLIR